VNNTIVAEINSRADRDGDEPLTPSEALQVLDKEFPLIEREPGRCAGQPTLKDTRFRVSDVLCAMANHGDIAGVIESWGGGYSVESWRDALFYAADYICETVPLDRGESQHNP
jgi:uncharacterized protein (DUF433 family)